MASPLAVSRMLPTNPPVRTVSATPLPSTVSIIRNASEIFEPPSTNTHGFPGAAISSEMTQYSFSNSRPIADGSTCSKPHRLGWSRCAAANASQT